MRKIVLTLVTLFLSQTVQAVEEDKSKHAQMGLAISMYTAGLAKTEDGSLKYAGLATGCAAGLAKEVYDSTGRGKTETLDFVYTCGGAMLGSFFSDSTVVYPDHNGNILFGISKSF